MGNGIIFKKSLSTFLQTLLMVLKSVDAFGGCRDGCCDGGCLGNGGGGGDGFPFLPTFNNGSNAAGGGLCPQGLFNGGFINGQNPPLFPPQQPQFPMMPQQPQFPQQPMTPNNGNNKPTPIVNNRFPGGGEYNGNDGNFGNNRFTMLPPPFQPMPSAQLPPPQFPTQQPSYPMPPPPILPPPQSALPPQVSEAFPPPRSGGGSFVGPPPQFPQQPIGPLRPTVDENVNGSPTFGAEGPLLPNWPTISSTGITTTGVTFNENRAGVDPDLSGLKHPFEQSHRRRKRYSLANPLR